VDEANVSGPSWASNNGAQLYAFEATMPPETSQHDFELMLQRFLTEQFGLKIHHQPRLFPSFGLTQAPGGAKLKPSVGPNGPDFPVLPRSVGKDGFPVLPPGHGYGIALAPDGGYRVRFQNFGMQEFARYLMGWVTPRGEPTRYVLDETGLGATYDFTLAFSTGERDVRVGASIAAEVGTPPESEPGGGPSIFRAVERQLGLKLVKGKNILLDTIVIDVAHRIPAGN
jgi:uncharacterized protein (TIGR03435 family)